MSSFIGHSLTALGIAVSEKKSSPQIGWLFWLVVLATAPDMDYLFQGLRPRGIRLTHSIVAALILPILTMVWLCMRGQSNRVKVIQAGMAGLSHLLLDMLVGVTSLPLLYPITSHRFRLPFGILPSAGWIHPLNPFLYRNLLIEVGVIAPVILLIGWMRRNHPTSIRQWIIPICLLVVSCGCMMWAFSLSR